MSEPITMQGEYQTRDGREVTLKFVDGRGQWPVRGYIGDDECLYGWDANGRSDFVFSRAADLIKVGEGLETK